MPEAVERYFLVEMLCFDTLKTLGRAAFRFVSLTENLLSMTLTQWSSERRTPNHALLDNVYLILSTRLILLCFRYEYMLRHWTLFDNMPLFPTTSDSSLVPIFSCL